MVLFFFSLPFLTCAFLKPQNLNLDTSLKAANGKFVKAKTVFAQSIRFMKDEAIQVISLETGDEHFKAKDIQWVLTVPAIWTPRAKQFMREAAYEVKIVFRLKLVF